MEEFDYRNFLVENKLTINSRLLSENETDLKKVEEKLKAASEVLSTFSRYAQATWSKYLTNSPTQADAQEQFMKVMSMKMEDVLSNLHKFGFGGIEPIEIFMKHYYPKYKEFYNYPTITQDDIGKANEALSAVTDVVNFINTEKRPSYKGEYKGTGFHNDMQKTTDDALRALDAFEKI